LEVEHKALDCWLGEWRGRAVKKCLISKDLQGQTRVAISFIIRGIGGVNVAKVEVRRNVVGGLGSKSKKWELVVEVT